MSSNYLQRKGQELVIVGVVVTLLPLAGLTLRGMQGSPPIMVVIVGVMLTFFGIALSIISGSNSDPGGGPMSHPLQGHRRALPVVDPEVIQELSERQARGKRIFFFVMIAVLAVFFGYIGYRME